MLYVLGFLLLAPFLIVTTFVTIRRSEVKPKNLPPTSTEDDDFDSLASHEAAYDQFITDVESRCGMRSTNWQM